MREGFCKGRKDFLLEIFRDLNDFVLNFAKEFSIRFRLNCGGLLKTAVV